MVTYAYNVSASGPVTSIQTVINQIVEELSTSPIIERDIEVFIGQGSYAGFAIPDGSLYPLFNTDYRLVIKSQGDFFPIIDFNFSSDDTYVGAEIGDGNPNVTIKGLKFQYFPVGIRVGLNSHQPIIHNNIVSNNRNVGIFFEQCVEPQVVQNIVLNGDYGIVVRLCKSAAIVHNTIFMNGAISTTKGKSISCIWAELATDYGNGLEDTGTLHMIGNIGWNTSGQCLTLFVEDVERDGGIVSNFNDWVVGDLNNFIVIEDNAFYLGASARPRRIISNLLDWKYLNKDAQSISANPKFIAPVKIRSDRNGYSLDLNLLPVSPVLGLVPSFPYNSTQTAAWLPSYLDSNLIIKDILGNSRTQDGTAAGANDKVSAAGFFGQDVFSNPLDLDLYKKCGISPFANVIYNDMDIWFPKLNKGYFYSNEREFYLYASKGAGYLGSLAVTKFTLPSRIALNKPLKIIINGKEIDSSYIDIVGTNLYLYHKDLEIITGEEEVTLQGSISTWKGDAFNYSEITILFKINEGITRYYLPEAYVDCGPIVITDDKSYPTDDDQISNREFSVTYDPLEGKSEIIFSLNKNLLTNCQFDYFDENKAPLYWKSNRAFVFGSSPTEPSIAGQNLISLLDDGYLSKLVSVSTGEPYCFSWHARSPGSGEMHYRIECYDSNHSTLGVVITGTIDSTYDWNRYCILFNSSGENIDTLTPEIPCPLIVVTGIEPPTRSAYASIQLSHIENISYTGNLYLDAFQYENTTEPSLYHRKPYFNELTVEYETSSEDYFIDTRQALSPNFIHQTDGFLYIPEIPAETYNGPDSPVVTTLHEWKWPQGRLHLLPWSRTKGKDKLRKRATERFNRVPEIKPEIISPVNASASIDNIEIFPSTPSVVVGDSNGISFIIKVTDNFNNPFSNNQIAATLVDYNLMYPGVLSKKEYGLNQQLSSKIITKTDASGIVSLTWIPPSEMYGQYTGPLPIPTLTSSYGDRISVVKTSYPINLDSFGNVTIFDTYGNNLTTIATSPIEELVVPIKAGIDSQVRLKYPISRNNISLWADGIYYQEAQTNILDSEQFFVDYENSIITIKGSVTNIKIQYRPSYVFISQVDPYKIMLYHDKIFGSYTGSIVLGYDFSIRLTVDVNDPANSRVLSKDFELIAQTSLPNRNKVINTLALEF